MVRTHKCNNTEILPRIGRIIEGPYQKVQVGIEVHQESDRTSRARAEQEIQLIIDVVSSTEESITPTKNKKEIFVTMYDLQDDFQKKMYTDQTGRFPTKAIRL